MFGLVNNGAKKHLFPICYIRFQLLSSTAVATSRANVLVDFLVNSLEFSTEEAMSTSTKELLGNLDSVATVVKKEPRLLSSNLSKVLPPNISLLQNLGISRADIGMAFHRHPRYLLIKPEWLERVVHQLEKDFHMPRGSRMFLHGIEVLVSLAESKLERKLDIFRSFGWSDSDICAMVRNLPYCLTTSEDKIRRTLEFFMVELGYESSYLASHAPLLKLSLEKRIMPRNEIFKILKENQLIKEKLSLYTVVTRTESQFLEKYVLPFRAKIPEVYDLYMKTRS
ncbi:uncharacterized protein LOC107777872 [Nicotiana tabacum]|uniref:Uncharacterized protein LOC107777872 n=2 Tax=Nicotiana TaxID=4085 RepID=A0A1S3YNE7_TOBAC|nr:PREDICTED: uncharacterized protein LOC104215366 [Nicotiana sylvestris]XP_016453522.1 PREDICTED: uncharacterized protein LOC107777872 isoform X2 [Nicotiana tabacum]